MNDNHVMYLEKKNPYQIYLIICGIKNLMAYGQYWCSIVRLLFLMLLTHLLRQQTMDWTSWTSSGWFLALIRGAGSCKRKLTVVGNASSRSQQGLPLIAVLCFWTFWHRSKYEILVLIEVCRWATYWKGGVQGVRQGTVLTVVLVWWGGQEKILISIS